MVGLLETNEEKLQFLIKNYFKLSQKNLAKEFEVTEAEMSKIVNNQENKLKNVHLLGFCCLYDVPYEIFKNQKLNTEEKITLFLDNYKSDKKKEIFRQNDKLLKHLIGNWYAYLYPSNPSSAVVSNGVWIVKTTITEDYRVIDEWDNKGILQIGKNQSLIIKESYDEGDLTIIRFQNRQVSYGAFRFVIVSTQNGSENEMVNFGFYSKKKYTPKLAKEILGDINKVQLKLDLDFNDRIINQIVIK